MARPSKYKKKYAKELANGIRQQRRIVYRGKSYTEDEFEEIADSINPNLKIREYSWSEEALCSRWGITVNTYKNWKKEYTSFEEACEIGDRDYRIYWMEKVEDGVALGKSANGALLKLLAGEFLGMTDKKEIKHDGQQKVDTININYLSTPKRQLEEKKESNIIDITDADKSED